MSHMYEWVMSHMYECVMSHMYEWVTSQVYKWVMSHMCDCVMWHTHTCQSERSRSTTPQHIIAILHHLSGWQTAQCHCLRVMAHTMSHGAYSESWHIYTRHVAHVTTQLVGVTDTPAPLPVSIYTPVSHGTYPYPWVMTHTLTNIHESWPIYWQISMSHDTYTDKYPRVITHILTHIHESWHFWMRHVTRMTARLLRVTDTPTPSAIACESWHIQWVMEHRHGTYIES